MYADEQFPFEVVEHLCRLGHDVLTVQAAENANLKIPDDLVLEFATSNDRVVLTLNRKDFKRLLKSQLSHAGMITAVRRHMEDTLNSLPLSEWGF